MTRKTPAVAPLAVLLLLQAPLLCADDPKVQDKDLDGEWELASVVIDGKEAPPPGDAKPAAAIRDRS